VLALWEYVQENRPLGVAVAPPNPTLMLPVTVEFLVRNGSTTTCFATPFTAARANDDQLFRATAP